MGCIRVFSTFVSCSNENKSCMRADESQLTSESLYKSFLNPYVLVENKSCLKVDGS